MEITGDMITQYGLMQKISTGNGVLDMVLVMLVPLIIRQALPWLYSIVQQFMTYHQEEKTYTRVIEFTRSSNYWWHSDAEGPSNQILQKALLTQINKRVDVIRALHRADFSLRNMTHHDADEAKGADAVAITKDDEEDNSKDHAYCINAAPPAGIWMDLGNGIKFQRVLENLDDKGKTTRTVYNLESSEADGNERIDKFVTEALELYKLQQRAKVDLSRYMYVPVLTGWQIRPAEGETAKPSAIYKRYKLSEEKTFTSFFHPEKDSILTLVNHFLNKTGKFGIAGYPNKLGLLLYGPPGTGKTSFIKALAQYTKRSIISIPLTKIQTNQTLMDLMMDQKVTTEDGEGNNSLPFSKTIFVMEDVDAAGTVVHRRAPQATTMTNMDLVVSGPVNKPNTREGGDEAEGKDRADKDSDDEDGEKKKKAIGPTVGGGTAGMGRSLWGGDDDLNLAGLLNVLDGVVDTPNRLVIMTTNHPEKLDPALIRPGRINKKIYMGRIKADDAVRMMNHYFGTLTEECIARLHTVFVDDVLSPAELEAMCAEHDTTEQMVEELDRKFTAKFGPALTETTEGAATVGGSEITPAGGAAAAAAAVPAPSALTASSAFVTHAPLPALIALDSVPGPCP